MKTLRLRWEHVEQADGVFIEQSDRVYLINDDGSEEQVDLEIEYVS